MTLGVYAHCLLRQDVGAAATIAAFMEAEAQNPCQQFSNRTVTSDSSAVFIPSRA